MEIIFRASSTEEFLDGAAFLFYALAEPHQEDLDKRLQRLRQAKPAPAPAKQVTLKDLPESVSSSITTATMPTPTQTARAAKIELTEITENEPENEPEKKEKPITMDEAKTKIAKYVREHGNQELKAALAELGYTKVSLIPEEKLQLLFDKLGVI